MNLPRTATLPSSPRARRRAATLPPALIRPTEGAFIATPVAASSLTLAVLRFLETDSPDDESVAMAISGERAFFHKVPGVAK